MVVELYIYIDEIARRIETFDDEKISITSSIQNINDISKVFTDYSQSFTIPANNNNNEIFSHWYENAIDNGFDQRRTYDGFIKIDTQTFRVGRWQLEGASSKENRIENYKITFYGNLKSLTDKFGEDKLKDIEQLNDYTITYNGNNVKDTITSTSDIDLTFPLITSNRVWQYGTGGLNDISTTGGAISYTELFPALKIKRIFDAIQNKYGVTFSGNFLTTNKFTKAYTLFKNSDVINTYTEKKLITLTNFSNSANMFKIQDNEFEIIKINGTQTILPNRYTYFSPKLLLTITFPTSQVYTLTVFKNNNFYTTITGTGTSFQYLVNGAQGLGKYKFYIQTTTSTTYTYTYQGRYLVRTCPVVGSCSSSYVDTIRTSGSGSGTLSANLDLTANAPDMKVSDFLSGVLKMFNLTAFSTDGVNFTLEQLENWYYIGKIKDYSQYTITDFDFSRIKPYKKINFEYEKSESVLNRNFGDTNGREYGNLSYQFNNDGSDYTIKLPFENILFNKFTGTDLQVAYSLNSDFNKYIPKPIILYKLKNTSCNFYFNNGTTNSLVSNYNVMGQDVLDTTYNTLNWGIEISSFFLTPITNSLFNNYYLAYLSNLYSLKSRMVKVKMRLPYSEILSLRLNDRIVIRNKRYIINQYTTDLQTFETDFELIQDFRSINFDNSRVQQATNEAQELRFYTTSVSPLTWVMQTDPASLIEDIKNENDYVQVKLYANTTGLPQQVVIESNFNDVIIIEIDA